MEDLGGFGRRSVVLMVDDEDAAPATEAVEFVPAKEKYEIEGRIGGGGMGSVGESLAQLFGWGGTQCPDLTPTAGACHTGTACPTGHTPAFAGQCPGTQICCVSVTPPAGG